MEGELSVAHGNGTPWTARRASNRSHACGIIFRNDPT